MHVEFDLKPLFYQEHKKMTSAIIFRKEATTAQHKLYRTAQQNEWWYKLSVNWPG